MPKKLNEQKAMNLIQIGLIKPLISIYTLSTVPAKFTDGRFSKLP